MDKRIDWAVIDHMSLGVASSTDSKVTDFGGSDPLAFSDLDADNIFVVYGEECRRSWTGGDSKGQGNGGGGVGGLWNNPSLSTVVLLFSLSEGEVDLVEHGIEDVDRELLQVTVEGVGV